MKSAEERILDLLNEKAPMTIRKIAEETSMPHSTCARVLAKLCEEDKIVKIQGSSSGRAYYLVNRDATVADVSNTGKSNSISTAMSEMGIDGSRDHRNKVAAANGIAGYSGSYTQNVTMLTLLKQGKLVKA